MSESDLVSGISTMMEHVHPLAHFGQKMLHIKMLELWLCLAYQHDGKRLHPLVGDFAQTLLFLAALAALYLTLVSDSLTHLK